MCYAPHNWGMGKSSFWDRHHISRGDPLSFWLKLVEAEEEMAPLGCPYVESD